MVAFRCVPLHVLKSSILYLYFLKRSRKRATASSSGCRSLAGFSGRPSAPPSLFISKVTLVCVLLAAFRFLDVVVMPAFISVDCHVCCGGHAGLGGLWRIDIWLGIGVACA